VLTPLVEKYSRKRPRDKPSKPYRAYDAELVDKPIRYGPNFKRPSKRVLRKQRNANGPRMFTP